MKGKASLSVLHSLAMLAIAASSSTGAVVETETLPSTSRRNLVQTIGTLKTLVIRIVDADGIAPKADVEQLVNDIFEDDACLKSQIEACSYQKLKIEPFSGLTDTNVSITNGVVEVTVDHQISINNNAGDLRGAAMTAATAKLGNLETNDKYNLIMYCMPPGTYEKGNEWLNIAYPKKSSFYNDESCSSVSSQLQSVGMNMNLAPSGYIMDGTLKKWGDKSGAMGSSNMEDDQRLCYNPAKSYQLGWYDDQVDTIDPLGVELGPVRSFVFNGVADYDLEKTSLIVLRLEQTALLDYYIGYNRQHGINKDTMEDGDRITIVRKESDGKSTKVASLFPGQSYTIEMFNDDRDVEIRFSGLKNGLRDAIVEVIDIQNRDIVEDLPCANYTIEFTTDDYPKDTAWYIVKEDDSGGEIALASSPEFEGQKNLTSTQVCLPYGSKCNFVVLDIWGDGLQGGSYRALDPDGTVVFSYEGRVQFKRKIESFEVEGTTPPSPDSEKPSPSPSSPDQGTFDPTSGNRTPMPTLSPTVPPSQAPTSDIPSSSPSSLDQGTNAPTSGNRTPMPTLSPTAGASQAPTSSPILSPTRAPTQSPTQAPTLAPTQSPTQAPTTTPTSSQSKCKDKKKRVRWKKKRKMRRCRWIAEKDKCNFVFKGVPVWQRCPVSCKRCEDITKSEEIQL